MTEPKKGDWYFSAKCQKCSATLYLLNDPGKGSGKVKLEGLGELQATCPTCGHTATYRLDRLESVEVK